VIVTVVVAVLLGLAVLVTVFSAVGVLVMRDPYQRLHFISPPASVSAVLVVVALLVYEPQKQAALKAFVVAFVLYFMNAVVTHATARAHFVRENGTWPPPKPIPDGREDK
jgi:monovalent cation/proton antiporter MnhG/PhaG subunit